MKTIEEIKNFCQMVSQQEGFILYDMVLGGRKRTQLFLRLSIDHQKRPVTVEDCSRVSKVLRWLLQAKNILDVERYDLEVSSPGVERILKEIWHYEKVVGKIIQLQLKKAYKDRYKDRKIRFKGVLKKVTSEGVALDFKKNSKKGEIELVFFPYVQIQKAHVCFDEWMVKKSRNEVSKRERRKIRKKLRLNKASS